LNLEIIDLSKVYKAKDKQPAVEVLRDINYVIEPGEFVSILGTSGCGKSTLLKIIAGLEQPTKGKVLLDGKQITKPGNKVGLIFQEYALFPWRTALQNIEFGPEVTGIDSNTRRAEALTYINEFKLNGFEHKYPRELSGGMKQRVAIARTLINNPSVILMDEPFGSLDSLTKTYLQEFLLEIWQTRKVTILFVTHDVTEAVFLSQKIIIMSSQPSVIKKVFVMDSSYPRDRTSVYFNKVVKQILNVIFE
jgi:NitT/TauT family transport system ATP-binding protein